MSPVFGTFAYGTQKYGYSGLPSARDLDRKLLSGNAPWLAAEGVTIPWRLADFAIVTVDPDTWLNVTPLPGVVGGQIEDTWEDQPLQDAVLTVQLAPPADYLPGGVNAALVAQGTLWRVRWTVRTRYGAHTYDSPVYRVQASPTRAQRPNGDDPLAVAAVSWVQQPLDTLRLAGLAPLTELAALRDTAIAGGLTPIGHVDAWATLAAAVLWTATGGRLVTDQWDTEHWQ